MPSGYAMKSRDLMRICCARPERRHWRSHILPGKQAVIIKPSSKQHGRLAIVLESRTMPELIRLDRSTASRCDVSRLKPTIILKSLRGVLRSRAFFDYVQPITRPHGLLITP